jgi:CRP-like cAMP-binding protein
MSEELHSDAIEDFLDLRSIPWLAHVETPTLQVLAEQFARERVPRGRRLQRRREPLERVLLVRSGELSVSFAGSRHRDTPDEPAFLLHALAGHTSGVEVRAESEAELFSIHSDDLWEALEEDFALLTHAVERLAANLCAVADVAASSRPKFDLLPDADLVRRILWLRGTSALSAAPVRGVAALAKRAKVRSLAAGETLWPAGEAASSLVFVLSGALETRGERAWPGALVGAREALAGQPRHARCAARQAGSVSCIDVELVWDLLEDDFAMARYLLGWLARGVLAQNAFFAAPQPRFT